MNRIQSMPRVTSKSPILVMKQGIKIFSCVNFCLSTGLISKVCMTTWKQCWESHRNISFSGIFIDRIQVLSRPSPVFSTFYSFIRLFANKRIEYEVGANKIWTLFVDTDKGALIRLFNYSQLKTKARGEI